MERRTCETKEIRQQLHIFGGKCQKTISSENVSYIWSKVSKSDVHVLAHGIHPCVHSHSILCFLLVSVINDVI